MKGTDYISASLDIVPYPCASAKDSARTSQIMSSNRSSSTSSCTASSMVDPTVEPSGVQCFEESKSFEGC